MASKAMKQRTRQAAITAEAVKDVKGGHLAELAITTYLYALIGEPDKNLSRIIDTIEHDLAAIPNEYTASDTDAWRQAQQVIEAMEVPYLTKRDPAPRTPRKTRTLRSVNYI